MLKQFSLLFIKCALVSTKVINNISTTNANTVYCSGNGWIAEGKCVCNLGYIGEQCDQEFEPCSGNGWYTYEGECVCYNGFGGDNCADEVDFKVPVASMIQLYIDPPTAINNGTDTLDGSGEVNIWASQFKTSVTRLGETICSLNTTDTEGCLVEVTGDYTLIYSVYGNEGELVTQQMALKPEASSIISIESRTKEDCVRGCYHIFGKDMPCQLCHEPLGLGNGWSIPFNYNIPNQNITSDPFQPREKDSAILDDLDSSVTSVGIVSAWSIFIPTCLWIIL